MIWLLLIFGLANSLFGLFLGWLAYHKPAEKCKKCPFGR